MANPTAHGRWNWLIWLLAFVPIALLATRQQEMFFAFPLTEDGYLSLSVARNIAIGKGISADGRELTNGFQPLWVFITAPWFSLFSGDRWGGVLGALATTSILMLLMAIFLGQIGKRVFASDSLSITLPLLGLTSHQLLIQYFNGLETGLLVTTYLAIALFYALYGLSTFPRALLGGLLLGTLILVRIDAGFFAVALLGLDFLQRQRSLAGMVRLAMAGIVMFVAASPWFAYGLWLTGSIMPISGQSLSLSALDWQSAIYHVIGAVARNAFPTYWTGLWRPLGLVATVAMAAVVVRGLRARSTRAPANEIQSRFLTVFLAFVASMSLLMLFYMTSSSAVYFWPRYLTPIAIWGVLLTGLFAEEIRRRSRLAAGLFLFVVCSPAIIALASWQGNATATALFNKATQSLNSALLVQVDLARRFRTGTEPIAAFQTGTLGFFLDGVYNLDGKVSISALKARRAHKTVDYMLDHDIGLFIDIFDFVTDPGGPLDRRLFEQNYELIYPDALGAPYDMGVFRRRAGSN